uniref:F-box domain-containing protein n=1 Tax=Mycena chlorophos TaxID=658473 RepID=A0ABQ0L9A2_MYCCL|nr:predicted protein [Mycena chlorophos]
MLEHGSGHWSENNRPLRCFRNTPLLSSLILRTFLTYPRFLDLPWTQLTKLETRGMPLDASLEAVRLCPNLTDLTLCVDWMPTWTESFGPPLTHPFIQRLRLTEHPEEPEFEDEEEVFVLSCFTLPALETLEIWPTHRMGEEVFTDFIRRSSPPLRNLSFKTAQGYALPEWLSMYSLIGLKITSLEIEHPPRAFCKLFFDTLASNIDMLPTLESLSMSCDEDIEHYGLEYFMERAGHAISLRRQQHSGTPWPLRSLRLVSSGRWGLRFDLSPDTKAIRVLQSLKEAGIEVYAGTAKQCVV